MMLYLVQVDAAMQRANHIDATEGPGPTFAKIVDRFRPEAIYGNPTKRAVLMIVDLDTSDAIAELMFVLTWFTGAEPTFTPLMKVDTFGAAIENAKRIVSPPT
jgi:hypothetical protein